MIEDELIERLRDLLPQPENTRVRRWIGDDCAVVATDGTSAISTDMSVEGTHFFFGPYFGLCEAGYRAIAVAASDLAAAGAQPREAFVAVGFPKTTTSDEVVALHSGIAEAAEIFNLPVAGGDLTNASAWTIAVTVVGSGREKDLATRRSARVGDHVGVSGHLGGAAAGLLIARDLMTGPTRLITRYTKPCPRLALGEQIAPFVSAMLDLSDGLALDLHRIAQSSNVRLQVDASKIPLDPGLKQTDADELEQLKFAVAGGDDYELCFCAAPDAIASVNRCASEKITWIGRVIDGAVGIDWQAAPAEIDSWRGWTPTIDQLKSS